MTSDFKAIPDRRVPSNIRFGLQKLEIPGFESQGIPSLFASRGFFDRSIAYRYGSPAGCWVERGDPLIQVRFIVYSSDSAPKGWFSRSDPTWTTTFELKSPVCGLLIDTASAYCGFYSDYPAATTSGSALAYGHERIWPVLLVPEDEPPADNHYVEGFFHNVGTLLQQQLMRLLLSTPGGHVRMSQARGDFNQKVLLEAQELLRSYERPKTGKPLISPITRNDQQILHNVQGLRKQDHELRDKLVHIVHFFEQA